MVVLVTTWQTNNNNKIFYENIKPKIIAYVTKEKNGYVLVVKNVGKSIAEHVKIYWNKEPNFSISGFPEFYFKHDIYGKKYTMVSLNLYENQKISYSLDDRKFEKGNMVYKGTFNYKDINGNSIEEFLLIDFNHLWYANSTYSENDNLISEIRNLKDVFNSMSEYFYNIKMMNKAFNLVDGKEKDEVDANKLGYKRSGYKKSGHKRSGYKGSRYKGRHKSSIKGSGDNENQ